MNSIDGQTIVIDVDVEDTTQEVKVNIQELLIKDRVMATPRIARIRGHWKAASPKMMRIPGQQNISRSISYAKKRRR